MKIAAIIDIPVTVGGGFNQALNAILQMARLAEGRFEYVVFTSEPDNISYLSKLGISAKAFRVGWKDRFISICALEEIGRRIQNRLRFIGNFEKSLIDNDVDLVYFVSPTSRCLSLQKLNYIVTVWDLCHRDTPEFPEVRRFNTFHSRERIYQHCLSPALLVVADSDILAERISRRYGIDKERLLAMPFAPGPFASGVYPTAKSDVLNKYHLEVGYFFYPAQFWAHKNHVRILQALQALKTEGFDQRVVFAGGDGGNLHHVRALVKSLGLESDVSFLGFVPTEDMTGLYQGCAAVVMPTYFGPTNLPPLEAWFHQKPLIYSSHLAQHLGDAALQVDPDDFMSIANAIRLLADPVQVARLISGGLRMLDIIGEERTKGESLLLTHLERFQKRRECWD